MNRKRIEKNLKRKHEEFVETIKNDKVRRLVEKNSIITGGSIVSMFLGEKVNDYDYYFTNKETCIEVAKYYTADFIKRNPNKMIPTVEEKDGKITIKIQSAGIVSEEETSGSYEYFESREQSEGTDYIEDSTSALVNSPERMVSEADEIDRKKLETLDGSEDAYRPVFMSSNAITLSNDVQLIIRFYGSPEEIHENYDFSHCTNYWLSEDKKLYTNEDALESILTKELKYQGSKYPLASVIRTRKFIQRGWKINAGQYLKMCFQISRLDLGDTKILQDQLTGVDSAYFAEVIGDIKKREKENPDWKLDGTYLATLVNKIF